MLTLAVDVDGIICHNGRPENYANAAPILATIQRLKILKQHHRIVLYTSRLEADREVTVAWLAKYEVPYDEIVFGKLPADYYIDDKIINFVPELGNTSLKRKPLALCYSGGMDSFIAYHWAIKERGYKKEDIVCISFDLNQPYKYKEDKAKEEIGIPYITFKLDLIQDALGNVPTVDNYIIPGRNMIFASIAAGFGETVWVVGVKFENHYLMYDKNAAFFRMATLALSQSLGAATIVETPFLSMSKTDMVRWAVKIGLKDELAKTVSCYDPVKKRCGECGLCFKRYIAMEAAGVEETDYARFPLFSDIGKEFYEKYLHAINQNDFTHYSKERIVETLDIFERYKIDAE